MTTHTTQLLNRIKTELVIPAMEQKNYKVFKSESKNYNLNIVGIRSSENIPDIFNDVLFLFWKYNGIWHERKYIITTDPGLYYLNNPIRGTRGTAIMKEQQVRGSHKIGKHQGRYLALKQQKPITVIRDFDRDNELDYLSGLEEKGNFGINIHNSGRIKSKIVHNWSAGCSVHQDPQSYKEFMQICKNSRDVWGNSFTYTLMNEKDL